MHRVWGVAVATVAALSGTFASAWAEGDQPGLDELRFQTRLDEPRFLLFSTADLWRHGGFAHGGVVWSPGGVDRDGFALKLMFGGGVYRYISGALGNAEVSGRQLAAAVLPGWRFVRGKFIASVYAGLDVQNHRLSPDDLSAGLRGGYAGLRLNVELWYEPTASTMIAADGSVSTIGASYNARLAWGWRVFDRYYIGPEVQSFAAGENYRQFRAGVHVTGLRMQMVEWSAGLGWASDSDDRDSAYGKLGLLLRR